MIFQLRASSGAASSGVRATHAMAHGGMLSSSPLSGGAGGVTNEQLAHELLLNHLFTIDENPRTMGDTLVHTCLVDAFEAGFWDSAKEEITSEPPSLAPVLNVLVEIKSGIQVCISSSLPPPKHQHFLSLLHYLLVPQAPALPFPASLPTRAPSTSTFNFLSLLHYLLVPQQEGVSCQFTGWYGYRCNIPW